MKIWIKWNHVNECKIIHVMQAAHMYDTKIEQIRFSEINGQTLGKIFHSMIEVSWISAVTEDEIWITYKHFIDELYRKLKINAFWKFQKRTKCTVILSDQEVLFGAFPCMNEVSLGFDDASALDDDGVAQDPLEPPVCYLQVLAALLHGLLKSCWTQKLYTQPGTTAVSVVYNAGQWRYCEIVKILKLFLVGMYWYHFLYPWLPILIINYY